MDLENEMISICYNVKLFTQKCHKGQESRRSFSRKYIDDSQGTRPLYVSNNLHKRRSILLNHNEVVSSNQRKLNKIKTPSAVSKPQDIPLQKFCDFICEYFGCNSNDLREHLDVLKETISLILKRHKVQASNENVESLTVRIFKILIGRKSVSTRCKANLVQMFGKIGEQDISDLLSAMNNVTADFPLEHILYMQEYWDEIVDEYFKHDRQSEQISATSYREPEILDLNAKSIRIIKKEKLQVSELLQSICCATIDNNEFSKTRNSEERLNVGEKVDGNHFCGNTSKEMSTDDKVNKHDKDKLISSEELSIMLLYAQMQFLKSITIEKLYRMQWYILYRKLALELFEMKKSLEHCQSSKCEQKIGTNQIESATKCISSAKHKSNTVTADRCKQAVVLSDSHSETGSVTNKLSSVIDKRSSEQPICSTTSSVTRWSLNNDNNCWLFSVKSRHLQLLSVSLKYLISCEIKQRRKIIEFFCQAYLNIFQKALQNRLNIVCGIPDEIPVNKEDNEEDSFRIITYNEDWFFKNFQLYLKLDISCDETQYLAKQVHNILIDPNLSDEQIKYLLSNDFLIENAELIDLLLKNRTNIMFSHYKINAKMIDVPKSKGFEFTLKLPEHVSFSLTDTNSNVVKKPESKVKTDYPSRTNNHTSLKHKSAYTNVVNAGLTFPGGSAKSASSDIKLLDFKRELPRKKKYPYVFDSNMTIKEETGFIQNARVMLPEGTKVKEKEKYQEIVIPPLDGDIDPKFNRLLPISSLHPVIQKAFSGMQSLNRVQSIVYEAAFHSNENLLICSPTGSGKTNIALLAMLNEIKQNIVNNVLQKDNFKMIYIAPLKALASEMVNSFQVRLQGFGLKVREFTGDNQLSRTEIENSQVLVMTPEKWDIHSRKSDGDPEAIKSVKLIIIDEVHILHNSRGHVIEAIVARVLRLVENNQKYIRLVALSATVPNYEDVARFLNVNFETGLFFFDSRFRPVPLKQILIGVKGTTKSYAFYNNLNEITYEKVLEMLKINKQVLIFVHSRNDTSKTAAEFKRLAQVNGDLSYFCFGNSESSKRLKTMRCQSLMQYFMYGIGIHHAGLNKIERETVEKNFTAGTLKVVITTATLAWGVNLPAHTVIIKGTKVYDTEVNKYTDLEMFDVLQMFGRAGRPQYDKTGCGVIITSADTLPKYVSGLKEQPPIESSFITKLADNLNAEISSGTIYTIIDAVKWLSYTYLHIRMLSNPMHYDMSYEELMDDRNLYKKRKSLILQAARELDKAEMIIFNERANYLRITGIGRAASNCYLTLKTVRKFTAGIKLIKCNEDAIDLLSKAEEFIDIKTRNTEEAELDDIFEEFKDLLPPSDPADIKVVLLLLCHIFRIGPRTHSLECDKYFITQNVTRLCRGLFEIVLYKQNSAAAGIVLELCKMLQLQYWTCHTPFRQFTILPNELLTKIESLDLSIEAIREMSIPEIGRVLRDKKLADKLKKCANEFPLLSVSATMQPVTRRVMKINVSILPDFKWNVSVHGPLMTYWLLIDDLDANQIHYVEKITITQMQGRNEIPLEISAVVPIYDPKPDYYTVKVVSDHWLQCETCIYLHLKTVLLPDDDKFYTDMLDLRPLPIKALNNDVYERLYSFQYFNPIQTHIFHRLYHTDDNVLLGAPTGSGKTIVAELAFLRLFNNSSTDKVLYIAPLKALVKERIADWKVRFEKKLHLKVIELTGDVTPDLRDLSSARIIVTTPEKWDGISRDWKNRDYVKRVKLIVIDEIHLLGEERGPVLEVIMSRSNFITENTKHKVRFVGLSTALANCQDLADWLGITEAGMYNFRPCVRPVPLEVHIQGFPGKHYCSRMATMNKPIYRAIEEFSPTKPVLIFVSSRRQTRLTALDLITFLSNEDDPRKWFKRKQKNIDTLLDKIQDHHLKLFVEMGIGIHHAGMNEDDRKAVEQFYLQRTIQVLIATATLAWGVNFPAHLVIVKGAEYYDGKTHRYVDIPPTDILQMIGRAGRPQFDDRAFAILMVREERKDFYKQFLYQPFPIESNLLQVLPDHINAEVVAGNVKNLQDSIKYIHSTYLIRRLKRNPSYYNVPQADPKILDKYIEDIIYAAIDSLIKANCVVVTEDVPKISRGNKDELSMTDIIRVPLSFREKENYCLSPTQYGSIISHYYISYLTIERFQNHVTAASCVGNLLEILSHACEYNQIPVRHNEHLMNRELAKRCPIPVTRSPFNSPHTKTFILLQAHFLHLDLPCDDYYTDLKLVLDQVIRILQALIEYSFRKDWLKTTLHAQIILQMVIQACWIKDNPLFTLPHITKNHLHLFHKYNKNAVLLPWLCRNVWNKYKELSNILYPEFTEKQIADIYNAIRCIPIIDMTVSLNYDGSIMDYSHETEQPMKQRSKVMIRNNETIDIRRNLLCSLEIRFHQVNTTKNATVYAPKFPKKVSDSWFLSVWDIDRNKLVNMSRINVGERNKNLCIVPYTTQEYTGLTTLAVFFVSDTYFGIDQRFILKLNVK